MNFTVTLKEPCGRFQGEDQEGFEERFINEFIGNI